MQIPAAAFIELARDQLAHVPPDQLADQERELREAIGGTAVTFVNGYHLGLQVARALLETSPLLGSKGIDASDLL
jgi:hypothetical protein